MIDKRSVKLAEHDPDSGSVTVCVTCRMCGKEYKLKVSEKGYTDWLCGARVQDAFPELPKGDRELFVSATCNDCWNNMFGF